MATPPVTALIALGSNLGDRAAHLRSALGQLAALAHTRLIAASTFHETEAVTPDGPSGQGPYLNAAARLETALPPAALLDAMLAIERAHGRDRAREGRWGARTLDLDLILFGELVIDEPGLSVPHPRLHERAFVLDPSREIAGDLRVPTLGRNVSELAARLAHAQCDGARGNEAHSDAPSRLCARGGSAP